jgi:2-C-methyl-D-erythritol 4-phosphate cytidylyltransferase
MEQAGHRPLLVPGSADNIKITDRHDLELASLYLELQARELGTETTV